MTFEEFQATRRHCDNLGAALKDASWDQEPTAAKGNLYLDDEYPLYIEEMQPHWPAEIKAQGRWYLIIGRSEWITDDLAALERKLYEFAQSEGLIPVAIEKLAEAAKPLDDDEWGSPRQIEAQNDFFDAVEERVSAEVFDGLSNYCMKADVYDMIEAGLQAVRGERDFAQYRSRGLAERE